MPWWTSYHEKYYGQTPSEISSFFVVQITWQMNAVLTILISLDTFWCPTLVEVLTGPNSNVASEEFCDANLSMEVSSSQFSQDKWIMCSSLRYRLMHDDSFVNSSCSETSRIILTSRREEGLVDQFRILRNACRLRNDVDLACEVPAMIEGLINTRWIRHWRRPYRHNNRSPAFPWDGIEVLDHICVAWVIWNCLFRFRF